MATDPCLALQVSKPQSQAVNYICNAQECSLILINASRAGSRSPNRRILSIYASRGTSHEIACRKVSHSLQTVTLHISYAAKAQGSEDVINEYCTQEILRCYMEFIDRAMPTLASKVPSVYSTG